MSSIHLPSIAESVIWQMPNFFILKDKDLKYLAASKLATHLLGYSSLDQIFGITSYEIKCEAVNFAEQYTKEDKIVIETNQSLSVFYIAKYADGNIYQLLANKCLARDIVSSEIIGVICQAVVIDNKFITNLTKRLLTDGNQYSNKNTAQLGCFYIDGRKDCDIKLTKQQSLCLFYLLRGKSSREISQILDKSPRTIEIHVEKLKDKFCCSKKSELIEKAINEGFLSYLPKELIINN